MIKSLLCLYTPLQIKMDPYIIHVSRIPSNARCANKDCSAKLKYQKTFILDDQRRPYCHRLCMEDANRSGFINTMFTVLLVKLVPVWMGMSF